MLTQAAFSRMKYTEKSQGATLEKITRVQDAEELARTLIDDAKEQAAGIVSDAQKVSASFLVESREKTNKEARTAGSKYVLQARQENEVLLSEATEKISALRAVAESRRGAVLAEATEMLLG